MAKNLLCFPPNRVPRPSEAMRMSLHGNVITATLAAELIEKEGWGW